MTSTAANWQENIAAMNDSSSTLATGASGDSATPANVPERAQGIYNGTVIVRQRDVVAQGDNAFGTGVSATGDLLYNGGGWDKHRNNMDGVVLITSAALTTNTNASDQTNYNHRGVVVFISPGTFGSGASTIVVTIEGKDPVSGSYYTILASASLTASTFTTLTVYPGAVASANSIANALLPRTWRVKATASAWGTGGSTVGVSCSLSV